MHTAEAAAAPAAAPTAAPAAPGTFWQLFSNFQTHLVQTHLAFSEYPTTNTHTREGRRDGGILPQEGRRDKTKI